MDCKEVNALLEDYLAHKLSKKRRKTLEEHISKCPFCQLLFLEEDKELESILTNNWFQEKTSEDFLQKVMEGLEEKKKAQLSFSQAGLYLLGISVYAFWGVIMLTIYLFVRIINPFIFRSLLRTCSFALLQLTITPLGYFALLVTMAITCIIFYYFKRREMVA